MIFTETDISDAYIIDAELISDDRGFFARGWCRNEFQRNGLNAEVVQQNISFNEHSGTLRGMHYQIAPHSECKLIRCTRGALYDVFVDLRPDSESYLQWVGVELTEQNYRMVYIPENCAHGFITLKDNTEAVYQVTSTYAPGYERGLRYDDPSFNIKWPVPIDVISQKDRCWEDYQRTQIGPD